MKIKGTAHHLTDGTVERRERGIYRIATYPRTDHERDVVMILR
ncbi:MAG: hypothetical protein WD273_08630 [Trueperaceae bacterium]